MENLIGQLLHEKGADETTIRDWEKRIKKMLCLDTIEITYSNWDVYLVTTNDRRIVDFHLDSFSGEIQLCKFHQRSDEGAHERMEGGGLTTREVVACRG